MSIILDGDFDGGNPRQRDRIVQRGEREFTIYPFSEDGDPNYKFRLDLKIHNRTPAPQDITLTVDWETERYMEYRDYSYLKRPGGEDWHYHPARVLQTTSVHDLTAEPGESYVCLHPRYSYGDYRNFVGSIPESGAVEKHLAGLSEEGREIWYLRISDSQSGRKRNLLFVARIHPYETSGSYCMEGIVEAFRNPTERMREVLKNNDIFLVPMIAPDGVYHGFGKLTSPNGVDLSKTIDERDASSALLKSLIDAIRPSAYIELHNWMFKDLDGVYYFNAMEYCRFRLRMPSQKRYGKTWKPMLRRKVFSFSPTGFKKYCRETYRSICACFEYPWFQRDIPAMKQLGVSTLCAVSRL